MFTKILTTAEVYEDDVIENGMINPYKKGSLKEDQKVLAVGASVCEIKPDDLVAVNLQRYIQVTHEGQSLKDSGIIQKDKMKKVYRVPQLMVDGKMCLLIDEVDVDFVIEDYEDVPDSSIQVVQNKLVV